MRKRCGASSLVGVLLFAVTAVAHAAPSSTDDAPSCEKHYTQGQLARERSALEEAREHMLACARAVCPAPMQRDCARWLEEVDVAMPTVVLEIRGAAPEDVTVTVDGAAIERGAFGTSIRLDPGPHDVRIATPGRSPLVERLVVYEGEKLRKVVFTFPTDHAQPVGQETRSADAPRAEARGSHAPAIPFYVALGIGAAALAGGLTLGIVAATDRSDLEAACAAPAGCSSADTDAYARRLVVADVFVGVGVVSLAVAGILYLTK